MADVIPITPNENFTLSFNFTSTNTRPEGLTISSATCFAKDDETCADVTATLLASANAAITGNVATVRVRNCVAGKRYRLMLLALLSDGSSMLEAQAILDCRAVL